MSSNPWWRPTVPTGSLIRSLQEASPHVSDKYFESGLPRSRKDRPARVEALKQFAQRCPTTPRDALRTYQRLSKRRYIRKQNFTEAVVPVEPVEVNLTPKSEEMSESAHIKTPYEIEWERKAIEDGMNGVESPIYSQHHFFLKLKGVSAAIAKALATAPPPPPQTQAQIDRFREVRSHVRELISEYSTEKVKELNHFKNIHSQVGSNLQRAVSSFSLDSDVDEAAQVEHRIQQLQQLMSIRARKIQGEVERYMTSVQAVINRRRQRLNAVQDHLFDIGVVSPQGVNADEIENEDVKHLVSVFQMTPEDFNTFMRNAEAKKKVLENEIAELQLAQRMGATDFTAILQQQQQQQQCTQPPPSDPQTESSLEKTQHPQLSQQLHRVQPSANQRSTLSSTSSLHSETAQSDEVFAGVDFDTGAVRARRRQTLLNCIEDFNKSVRHSTTQVRASKRETIKLYEQKEEKVLVDEAMHKFKQDRMRRELHESDPANRDKLGIDLDATLVKRSPHEIAADKTLHAYKKIAALKMILQQEMGAKQQAQMQRKRDTAHGIELKQSVAAAKAKLRSLESTLEGKRKRVRTLTENRRTGVTDVCIRCHAVIEGESAAADTQPDPGTRAEVQTPCLDVEPHQSPCETQTSSAPLKPQQQRRPSVASRVTRKSASHRRSRSNVDALMTLKPSKRSTHRRSVSISVSRRKRASSVSNPSSPRSPATPKRKSVDRQDLPREEHVLAPTIEAIEAAVNRDEMQSASNNFGSHLSSETAVHGEEGELPTQPTVPIRDAVPSSRALPPPSSSTMAAPALSAMQNEQTTSPPPLVPKLATAPELAIATLSTVETGIVSDSSSPEGAGIPVQSPPSSDSASVQQESTPSGGPREEKSEVDSDTPIISDAAVAQLASDQCISQTFSTDQGPIPASTDSHISVVPKTANPELRSRAPRAHDLSGTDTSESVSVSEVPEPLSSTRKRSRSTSAARKRSILVTRKAHHLDLTRPKTSSNSNVQSPKRLSVTFSMSMSSRPLSSTASPKATKPKGKSRRRQTAKQRLSGKVVLRRAPLQSQTGSPEPAPMFVVKTARDIHPSSPSARETHARAQARRGNPQVVPELLLRNDSIGVSSTQAVESTPRVRQASHLISPLKLRRLKHLRVDKGILDELSPAMALTMGLDRPTHQPGPRRIHPQHRFVKTRRPENPQANAQLFMLDGVQGAMTLPSVRRNAAGHGLV